MSQTKTINPRRDVWPFVIYTGVVFGTNGLFAKSLIDRGVDTYAVTALPFFFAAGLAWAVAWRRSELDGRALIAGLVLGSINSALPTLFFNLGLETLPAGLVTLLASFGPVVTAVTAHLVFTDERFSRRKGLGLLVAFGGVATLVATPGVIEGASYRGALWAVGAAVIAGTTGVVARIYAIRHGGVALLPTQLTVSGLIPLGVGVVVGRSVIPWHGIAASDLMILAGMGIVASYLGFRSMMLANQRGTTGQVSMLAYLMPLVGVVGGVVFLHEDFTFAIAAGAALILAGIGIGGRASAPTPPLVPVSSQQGR